jgi:phosphate acetyltransferase
VHPCDESSLRGVVEATNAGLIEPTLVGPAAKIKGAAAKHDIDIGRFEISTHRIAKRPPPRPWR